MFSSLELEGDLLMSLVKNQGFSILWETFGYGGIVAFTSTLFGATWGYLCARYDFPYRKFFLWLLPAPMAIPVYVYSFVYLSLWQKFISYDKSHLLFLFVFILSASPYAFLLSFVVFKKRPQSLVESAELLGWNSGQFWRNIHWPFARPLLVSAFFIVLFEYLSDFGASQIFGINTLSTVIYKVWNAYFSFPTAAFLALFLMCAVILFLVMDLGRKEFSFRAAPYSRIPFPFPRALIFAASLTLFFSFFIPMGVLFAVGMKEIFTLTDLSDLFGAVQNTLILSLLFSFLIVFFISLLVYVFKRGRPMIRLLRLFTQFGYAMPGTALAVAVTVPFFYLQRYFDGFSRSVLIGLSLMFLAWFIRFFKVGWDPIEKSRLQYSESTEEAGQFYIKNPASRWLRLNLPMISSGTAISFFLLFLESMKELPIVLLTRPYGWDNLAIKFFEFSNESEWEKAAPYGLFIVFFGLIGNFIFIQTDKT